MTFQPELMDSLTPRLRGLHARALDLSKKHRQLEWDLVVVLQEVDRTKLFKKVGYSSLFTYSVQCLGFTESVAYAFISVARKSLEVKELKAVLQAQKLSVSKAHRLVSSLNPENAQELLEFAETHTTREVEREMARRNPRAAPPDRAREISEEGVQLQISVSRATYEGLLRAQSLEAQRTQSVVALDQALARALEFYLERNDPVRKARRKATMKKRELCALLPLIHIFQSVMHFHVMNESRPASTKYEWTRFTVAFAA
ncbi:MAG: hypothetical protein AB7G93_12030 [Bdellovibrionales bacterium]